MPNFLTYGQTKGLAYQHDWKGEIEGLYQREAYAAQQEEMTQQKARYYGELLKKPSNVRTEYNSRRLDEFYKAKMKEIGDFVIDNPDFEKDIGLMAKFNQLADSIMNNPIVQEELQVEEEFNLLKANRDKLTREKYFLEAERYSNYINQDPDVSESEKVEPYFFNKFLVVDPIDIVNKAASDVATTYRKTTVEGQQIYAERFDPESLEEIAFNYYMVEENRNALDSHFNKLDDNIKQMYGDTYNWFKTQISAREDKRFLHSMLQREGAKEAPFDTMSPAWRDIGRHMFTGSIPRAANPENIAFTTFAEPGNIKSLRELEETGGAYVKKDGKLVPLDVSAYYQSRSGGGQIIEIDGKWYTNIPVDASLSHSQAQKESIYGRAVRADTRQPLEAETMKLGEALAKAGFQSQAEVTSGLTPEYGPTTRTNIIYQGEIFVPMDINEITTDRYNKEMAIGGQKQLESMDRSLDYHAISAARFTDWLSAHERKPLRGLKESTPIEIDDDGIMKWAVIGRRDGAPVLVTKVGDQPHTKRLTNQEYLEYKTGR